MKALILCAGSGTRLKPLTDSINKHLLEIADKKMVLYAVDHAWSLGQKDIVIVYNKRGDQIPDVVSKYVRDLGISTINVKYVLDEPGTGGIAASLKAAQAEIGQETFMVHFGDVLYEVPQQKHLHNFLKVQSADSAFLLDKVENPSRHASVIFKNGKIETIIEKCSDVNRNTVVLSLDIYSNKVWNLLEKLKPSKRGELEITDLRNLMIQNFPSTYSYVEGFWIDAGTHESLAQADAFFSTNT